MMNKTSHSISSRQGIRAAFLLAFAFMLTQAGRTQAQTPQWVNNGNNMNNTNIGNVGIGPASPNTRLSITPTTTEPKITLWDGGTATWHFGFGVSNNQLNYHVIPNSRHVFYQGGKNGDGVPLMIINGVSNVGATIPSSRLLITPTTTEPKITLWDGGSTSFHYGFGVSNNQLNYHVMSGGSHVFYQGGKNGNGEALMIIKGNGYVGIGTTEPSAKLHVVGDVTVTGNIAARYQDVAEWVPANRAMPAGTVVVLDTEQSNQVVASFQAYDTRVAGVISASPGVILGEGGEGKVMVATTGRVKVKVDATRGPIRVGDLLVTSDKDGIAMRSEPLKLSGESIHRPGTIIGKALEPLDKGVGEILVLLSLQ